MLKVATAVSGGLAACEFALKYENIDHEVVFACEWDKFSREQYLQFHKTPTKAFYEDIQNLDAKPYLNKIDLFVFGSPCQDLSLAGQRKGFLGEKSSLFRHGARVLEEMKPKTFIFENVKGLLSSNNGKDYKEVLGTFKELGYLIAVKVLNAKDYGTAQNRERVFIVGFLDAEDYHNFSFEDKKPLKKVVGDYLDDKVDEKYFLSQKMLKNFSTQRHSFKFEPHSKDDKVSKCLTARYSKMGKTDPYIKEPALKQIGNIDTKGHNSLWGRVYSTNGIGSTLNANGGGCGAKTGLYFIEDSVDSGLFKIRRLAPKECFRLMGVKDEDIEIVVSDTQAYKIAGNGIEINTMRSILRSLYKPTKNKGSLF